MARVLVIDDEAVIRSLIEEILADAGHDVLGAGSAAEGLERLDDGDLEIVVSDIIMPGLTGLELLEEVRRRRPSLPVVLVTGAGTHALLTDALAGGADGLVMKPFSHAELQRAVSTALDRARRGERELRERLLTPTLAGALANAIEARDSTMQGHCERLNALALRIGVELELDGPTLEAVRLGAILHDVGKIGIPDRVLIKNGALSTEERALMKTHPLIGDRLLEPLELLQNVRPVVRHHHERWDGTGYPDGLAGETIPLAARVVALADAVEAMSGNRSYREPLTASRILRELDSGSGSQWDPALVVIARALILSGELAFGPDGLSLSRAGDEKAGRPAYSILVVEDDTDHALRAKEALERTLGHVAVRLTATVAGALDLCRSSTWSLVLIDEHLPDGSGLDLMQTLRSLSPELPVVMLTAAGPGGLAVEAFRRGASDYVVKSSGLLDDLTGRVKTLLVA